MLDGYYVVLPVARLNRSDTTSDTTWYLFALKIFSWLWMQKVQFTIIKVIIAFKPFSRLHENVDQI